MNGSVTASHPSSISLLRSPESEVQRDQVIGSDKKAVKLGEGMLMDSNTMLMVPVSGTLAVDSYTVDWHAPSGDGHKTHGSYRFTVTSKLITRSGGSTVSSSQRQDTRFLTPGILE